MYKVLNKLNFVKIAGSKEELKAIEIIGQEILNLGFQYRLEEFKIPYSNIDSFNFSINDIKYEATPFLRCANIHGEYKIQYIEDASFIDFLDLKDKFVLIYTRLNYSIYESLAKKQVKGIIVASGSVYDDKNNTDLEINILRDKHLENGVIPVFTMRLSDIENVVLNDYHDLKITLEETQIELNSNNIICDIVGESEEVIVFSAHYDSVYFSKGIYDNATGVVSLLELMKRFTNKKPKYTLRFIFFGAEERGLLGSKYHNSIEENLKNVLLNINVDMTSVILGFNLCCVSANNNLTNYLDGFLKSKGYLVKVYKGVYSSDSTPFADKGIASMSFARDSVSNGAKIHSRLDDGTHLSEKFFLQTVNMIYDFYINIEESIYLPFNLKIDDEIKTSIDKYYLRKKD